MVSASLYDAAIASVQPSAGDLLIADRGPRVFNGKVALAAVAGEQALGQASNGFEVHPGQVGPFCRGLKALALGAGPRYSAQTRLKGV